MSYILDALRKAEQERGSKTSATPAPKENFSNLKRDHLMLAMLASSMILFCSAAIIIALLVLRTDNSANAVQIIKPQEKLAASTDDKDERKLDLYDHVPWLANMPKDFTKKLPNLKVNAHIHAAENARTSFVILAGERLRNGETSKTGLNVVFIDKDSLVLRYRDTLLRLPVEY